MHEVVQCLERLVDGSSRIRIVLVVEVDAVGAEPAQAGLARRLDPPPQRAPLVGLVGRAGRELRGDHHVVPPPAERVAEELLRLAAAVHLGGVEVRDPGVERGVDDRARRVLVDLHPEVVAAEAHHGHRRAFTTEHASLHRAHSGRTRRCPQAGAALGQPQRGGSSGSMPRHSFPMSSCASSVLPGWKRPIRTSRKICSSRLRLNDAGAAAQVERPVDDVVRLVDHEATASRPAGPASPRARRPAAQSAHVRSSMRLGRVVARCASRPPRAAPRGGAPSSWSARSTCAAACVRR